MSGGLQRRAAQGGLPVTGDWVALRVPSGDGVALVEHVLPRRTAFVRKAAGEADVEQVVAANLDVAFLVMALDELNARRLERFLAAAWESGAEPVVVLTKSDLAADAGAGVAEAQAAAPGVPVHAISSVTGEGVDELRAYLRPNRTAALLGVSGAGKSRLVNRLLERDRQAIGEVRSDGRGRHTTSHRELFLVPGGGLVLDTPGHPRARALGCGRGRRGRLRRRGRARRALPLPRLRAPERAGLRRERGDRGRRRSPPSGSRATASSWTSSTGSSAAAGAGAPRRPG